MSARDLVSVVVPARNEEASIERCVRAILAQTHRELEVLVVDGDSNDRTPEIVRRLAGEDPRVRLLHNPDRVIPRSLNLALSQARGRWLVRVDAHAFVPPTYVERIVSHLSTGRWGGVGGRKDGVGVTPAGKAVSVAMGSRFGVGNSLYHYGEAEQEVEHVPFGAYPTALARALGGWNEDLAVNQDFEFDHRVRSAGYPILFDPELRIDWECRQSIPDLFSQYLRYGRGKTLVMLLHPDSVKARHLAAPSLVAWLLATAVLAPRRPRLAGAAAAPYLLALLAASAANASRLGTLGERVRLPLAFSAMHVGWGVGFWRGLSGLLVDRLLGRPAPSPTLRPLPDLTGERRVS